MRVLVCALFFCLLAACASAPPKEVVEDIPSEPPVVVGAVAEPAMHAVVPSAPVPAPLPAGTSLGQQVKAEQILDLPAQYYAVQLVAFRDKKDILDFIARHQLGDPPYGRVLRQGEVWYVLVYGVWPSKVEAEAAVAAMPPVLRSVAPWVRKLGDLQTAIRALM